MSTCFNTRNDIFGQLTFVLALVFFFFVSILKLFFHVHHTKSTHLSSSSVRIRMPVWMFSSPNQEMQDGWRKSVMISGANVFCKGDSRSISHYSTSTV